MKKFSITFLLLFTVGAAHAANNCTGATYYDSTSDTCISCPAGYDANTDPGKDDITDCQIHCDAGTWKGGYTELEYIESTGEQYIDTLYRPSAENVTYDFSIENTNNAYGERHFTYIAGGNIQLFLSNTYLRFYEANPRLSSIVVAQNYNEKIDVVLQNNYSAGMLSLLINGSDKTPSGATVRSNAYSNNLFIFSFSNGNYRFKGKMYYYKLYENNELVRDFVPARRDADGAIGVYDKVTSTFFINSGTEPFTAGADKGGICSYVGAGYWSAASTVNYGSAGIRNACPVGTTTVGYGHGADSANDCGRTLHVGDGVLYMRKNKETSPSVGIDMGGGDVYYISLDPTNHNMSPVHFWHNGTKYTAYDDSLFYNERDFMTGASIAQ